MDDSVTYSGTMPFTVFWRAYLRHVGRSRRWLLIMLAVILLFGYVLADSLADFIGFVLPYVALMAAMFTVWMPWWMFRRYPAFQKPISGTVSSAGFESISVSGRGQQDWSQIVRVIDGGDCLLLYSGPIQFNILPRRFFASEQDWELAKQFALTGSRATTQPQRD